jgi:hypothetical protein
MSAVEPIPEHEPRPLRHPVDRDLADWLEAPEEFAGRPAYVQEAWRPFPTYEPRLWGDPAPTLRTWVWRKLARRTR